MNRTIGVDQMSNPIVQEGEIMNAVTVLGFVCVVGIVGIVSIVALVVKGRFKTVIDKNGALNLEVNSSDTDA